MLVKSLLRVRGIDPRRHASADRNKEKVALHRSQPITIKYGCVRLSLTRWACKPLRGLRQKKKKKLNHRTTRV